MARRNVGVVLLLLSAPFVEAIRLHVRQGGPATVLGTTMLVDQEMAGKQPVFVDAFPSADGADMHIVLNFSPLFERTLPGNKTIWTKSRKQWSQWADAMWQCQWATSGIVTKSRHASANTFSISSASILHSTLDEFAENLTSAKKSGGTFFGIHHAMVLSCPVPPRLAGSDEELYLSISARGSRVKYKRSHIPVVKSALVQPGTGSVLCTMVFKEDQIDKALPQWLRYHIAMGIDQVLVYVEDADATWASEVVADLPEAGKVTVVPFYFGNVSDQRAFHMQGGMENHCLYQARGRAQWLAHADIDEYFESKAQAGPSLRDYLGRVPSGTGAVEVRSQFWADTTHGEGRDAPFPCYITCKQPSYFPEDERSKWFARPELVRIYNPHIVSMTGSATRYQAPPALLRVNHYKECRPDMDALSKTLDHRSECAKTETCVSDSSFRDVCVKVLGER